MITTQPHNYFRSIITALYAGLSARLISNALITQRAATLALGYCMYRLQRYNASVATVKLGEQNSTQPASEGRVEGHRPEYE